MGISRKENQLAEKFHYNEEEEEIDTEDCDSDDSQEDPTFDVIEETRSNLSSLSLKKKCKSRIITETEEGNEEVPDLVVEMVVPELNEEDQKSFEVVQKIIEVGHVEKLKVDQCKVYLRKHGLRLTGNKDTLIGRIKEHLEILGGGAEKKYPMSSFVLNCKGDACMGDVVMFEQNVYEMFNIASRSASGPPCGKRIVAGHIVKESYGAAKQQHTFTIEVLWSKGEKPLPPLHPLLIKGRNLYRLKTMRQRWENEDERRKILFEKHARGSLARSNREVRIQLKETRKILKANRVSMEEQNVKKKETRKVKTIQSLSIGSEKLGNQTQEQKKNMKGSHEEQKLQQQECQFSNIGKENNTSVPLGALCRQPGFFPNVNVQSERIHQSQHSTSAPSSNPFQSQKNHEQSMKSVPLQCSFWRWQGHERSMSSNPSRSPFRRPLASMNCSIGTEYNDPHSFRPRQRSTSPLQRHNHQQSMNYNPSRNPLQRHGLEQSMNSNTLRHDHKQRQLCRFYAQGRCYFGDQCKYLHEYRENRNCGQRNEGRWCPSDQQYYY